MEITAKNIAFKTIKKTIIRGATFSCETGKRTAFFGPEGSGKKVLLLMLGGFLRPTSGSVRCDGKNISANLGAYRQKIGLGTIDDINPLPESLTLRENLEFCMEIKGLKHGGIRTEKILEHFGIDAYADTPMLECDPLACALASLACACAADPEMIILDEPTKKLTSLQAQRFWQIAKDNLERKTVLFSTKNFQEAEANADIVMDMAELAQGKAYQNDLLDIAAPVGLSASSGDNFSKIDNIAI